MSNFGEVDVRYGVLPLTEWTSLTVVVRGVYCLLVVAHMLDIVTPELIDGTAAFIASCQTYEGGFSSASHPHFANGVFLARRPSLGEAHGGYTFCALASWVLLRPYLLADEDGPRVDARRLLRWLVQMQGSEIELGGFKGRTNKLVDGCYSWWVGGAFALLEALGVSGIPESPRETPTQLDNSEDSWDDIDGASLVTSCWVSSGVNDHATRLAFQSSRIAGVYPHCRTASGGRSARQTAKASASSSVIFLRLRFHAGMGTPTILLIAYLACRPHSTVCARRLHAEKRCVRSGRAKMASALRLLPRLSAGKRTKVALVLSVRVRTVSYVAYLLVSTVSLLRVLQNATHPLFNLTITHTEGIMAHFYKQSVPKRVPKRPH